MRFCRSASGEFARLQSDHEVNDKIQMANDKTNSKFQFSMTQDVQTHFVLNMGYLSLVIVLSFAI